jgi:tyrosyl-tRNA synthetase
MLRYYELLTDVPPDKVKAMHPRDAKKKLASHLVSRFYGDKAAMAAEVEFEAIFKEGGRPQEIELVSLPKKEMNIVDLLSETRLAPSKSEARRLIQQGGVAVDDELVKDDKLMIDLGRERLLKVGKRKFLKVMHS